MNDILPCLRRLPPLALMIALFATTAIDARPTAAAEPGDAKITLAGLQLGRHVSGPACTAEALTHRPVLLEFWGIHCPPCLKSMPLLEELHRTLGPQGLVVIGAHAQDGSADEIRAAVAQREVTFTIVEQAAVQGGMDFTGIPHCMLFDHTGACVYRGSPFEVGEAALAAVKAAPGAVLQGRTLVKLVAFNEMVRHERQFGAALKKAKGLVNSKNADTAAEATFVVERLEARGREMLEAAASRKADDPLGALEVLQRCGLAYRGSDLGAEAERTLREWKKDAEFRAAVKAAVTGREMPVR